MSWRACARACATAGVSLDPADLEACYPQAWHGLYTTMLEGEAEVANPEGWLALVTYRRAIDEHRSRVRTGTYAAVGTARAEHDGAPDPELDVRAPERDLAGELDDRARLRQLMEGLRGRLSPRERQAAALCYLQGCSRADAAARMGISVARMRKLMDGARPGSPGVASKVGELLDTIRAGSYCAEQSSLMRGFAFGILDPDGERYALAMAHQRECPACRAHVLSLRGLASVLPPLPLPLVLGAGAAAGAGATTGVGAGTGAVAGTGASVGTGVGATGAAGGSRGRRLAAGRWRRRRQARRRLPGRGRRRRGLRRVDASRRSLRTVPSIVTPCRPHGGAARRLSGAERRAVRRPARVRRRHSPTRAGAPTLAAATTASPRSDARRQGQP